MPVNIKASVHTTSTVQNNSASRVPKTPSFSTQIRGNPYNQARKPGFLSNREKLVKPSMVDKADYLDQFQKSGAEFSQGRVMRPLLNDSGRNIEQPAKDKDTAPLHDAKTASTPQLSYSKSAARGACLAFSALWLRMMPGSGNKTAAERMNQLSANAGRSTAVLQKVYRDYGVSNASDTTAHESVKTLENLRQQLQPEIDAKVQQLDHATAIANQQLNAYKEIGKNVAAFVADYNADVKKFNQASTAAEQNAMSPILEEKKQVLQQAKQLQEEQGKNVEGAYKIRDTILQEHSVLIEKWNQYTAKQNENIKIHNQIVNNQSEDMLAADKQILQLTGLTVTEKISSGHTPPPFSWSL